MHQTVKQVEEAVPFILITIKRRDDDDWQPSRCGLLRQLNIFTSLALPLSTDVRCTLTDII